MKKLILVLLCFACLGAAAQTGNIVVPAGHARKVAKVVLDKQGKYLYTVETAKIIMWDAKTHEQLYTFPLGVEKISNLAVSNDGTKIAVGCEVYIKCFSTVTGKPLILGEAFYMGNWVAFSPDSKLLYTVDDGIDAYNFETQKKTKLIKNELNKYDTRIEAIDDTHVITYTDFGWKVWNLEAKSLDFEYKIGKQAYKQDFLPNLNCIA
jgi:WD40 repeat protein